MASTSAPMGGRAATGQGLFTRQSSGLVRALGVPAATGIAVATISVVMLLVVGAVSLVSIRRLAQVILVLVGIQLLAFLVLGWLLITHSHQDFVNALASFSNHPGAYNDIIAAAQKDSIPLGFSIGASLTAVPFMVLNSNAGPSAYS